MQEKPTRKRTKGAQKDPTKVKTKFQEQREREVQEKPLRPMNQKQQIYMELLQTKSVVVACGFAGTSKSFIAATMSSDLLRTGKINKVMYTRPAISSSKSLGYFSGDATEKLKVWLGSVIPIIKSRLGEEAFEIALKHGDVTFVPLETIKGLSINDAWLICEEASDLTRDEVIKLITRMGKNSVLVLAGDVRQSELKDSSGLVWLRDFIKRHDLSDNFGFIDFNETSDIVRSDAVKRFITALVRDEKENK